MAHPVGPFKVRKFKSSPNHLRWQVVDTRTGNSVAGKPSKEEAQTVADQKNIELLVLKGLPV